MKNSRVDGFRVRSGQIDSRYKISLGPTRTSKTQICVRLLTVAILEYSFLRIPRV